MSAKDQTCEDEIWRDVVGYEGIYQVSNLGRVRSVDRLDRKNRLVKGRLIKTPKINGYPSFALHKDGKRITTAVHIQVAAAFIGPRPHGHQVAHNDGNPGNPSLRNLRYATPRENNADKHLHGTISRASGSINGHAKLNESDVLEIVRLVKVCGLRQSAVAERFDIDPSMISHIMRGKHWTCITKDSRHAK